MACGALFARLFSSAWGFLHIGAFDPGSAEKSGEQDRDHTQIGRMMQGLIRACYIPELLFRG